MRVLRAMKAAVLKGLVIGLVVAAWPTAAVAELVTNPLLPPTEGAYVSPDDWHVYYTDYGIYLEDASHFGFDGVMRTPGPGYEEEQFESIFTANTPLGPITLTGSVTMRAYGYSSGALGSFELEMIDMLLTGTVGGSFVQVREDVNEVSYGSAEISGPVEGYYDLLSSVVVYTELKIDDGEWAPGTYEGTAPLMEFKSKIPEPSAAALAVMGLLLVGRRR